MYCYLFQSLNSKIVSFDFKIKAFCLMSCYFKTIQKFFNPFNLKKIFKIFEKENRMDF